MKRVSLQFEFKSKQRPGRRTTCIVYIQIYRVYQSQVSSLCSPLSFSPSILRPLGNPAHMHIKLAIRLRLSNSSCPGAGLVSASPPPIPPPSCLLRPCAVNCQCATMRCSFCFIFYAASHFDFADFVWLLSARCRHELFLHFCRIRCR